MLVVLEHTLKFWKLQQRMERGGKRRLNDWGGRLSLHAIMNIRDQWAACFV